MKRIAVGFLLLLLLPETPFAITTVTLGGSHQTYLHGLRTNNLGSISIRHDAANPAGLSNLSPLKGKLTVINPVGFARDDNKFAILNYVHLGVDIAAAVGDDVLAVQDGIVKVATLDPEFGGYIALQHSSGYVTLYGHLGKILVRIGQLVRSGAIVGQVGLSGLVKAPSLHFGIVANFNIYYDPTTLLHN
jgi:murein DD-endopeptidase MepM/ murein hydrolase activator NlpD